MEICRFNYFDTIRIHSSLLFVIVIFLLIWPNSMGKPTLLQAFAQNSTMAIDTAKLLAGDAIQALNHKDLNGALEHLKLIDQHFRQTLVKNSTMAIDTAKLLAGDAIQALNHKDLNGGLEHLKLIVQELGTRGNSTFNSSLISHLRTHIPAITSKQSALYAGSEAHAQVNMTSSNATGGANMTSSNATAVGGANMTQPLVPPKQSS
jgi:hypothetical protein